MSEITTTAAKTTPLPARAPQSVQEVQHLFDASLEKFRALLPSGMTPQRFVRSAMVAINRTPKLMQCTLKSLLMAMMEAAQVGLDPGGGTLGEGYLIPYGDEAKFVPGYRGMIALAHRSEAIEAISAEVVYAQDQFSYEKGMIPSLKHRPMIGGEELDSDIVGAYCVIWMKARSIPQVEFMSRIQIDKTRASSRAGGTEGPWSKWYSQMARKTVIRRALKYVPISSDSLLDALSISDRNEFGDGQDVLSAQTAPALGTESVKKEIRRRREKPVEQAPEEVDIPAEPSPAIEKAAEKTEGQNVDMVMENAVTLEWSDYCDELSKVAVGISAEDLAKALSLLALRMGKKGREKDITQDKRRKLWIAAKSGKIKQDGSIEK
jgi:recombination protein RecT